MAYKILDELVRQFGLKDEDSVFRCIEDQVF